MTIVQLWEDNAGGLAIRIEGSDPDVGYTGLEHVAGGSFAIDAAALAAGITQGWTVDPLPAGWEPGRETSVVAEYNSSKRHVQVVGRPGRAAARYLGMED